jgi:hypothetical protein
VVPIGGRAATFDLRVVACAVIRSVKELSSARKVTIHNDVRACDVRGDRAAVQALVHALVVAAIERSPRYADVTVFAAAYDGGVLLRVIDRGDSDPAATLPGINIPVWYESRLPGGRAACACLASAVAAVHRAEPGSPRLGGPPAEPPRGRTRTTCR